MEEGPSRKLAVILHADVAGSTALVRLNEILAHQRIRDAFRRFAEIVSSHDGIAHEIRGDAMVAEFARASDAVAASVDFQAANSSRNQDLSDEIRPVVRVGIAMGEVVIADSTVTGEGVVLAQRLEQLADPGGVCIQDAAYQTVPKRLPFQYESLGEQEVKGFEEPVRAYRLVLETGASKFLPDTRIDTVRSQKVWPRAVGGVVALFIVVGGWIAWWQPWQSQVEPASVERVAIPLFDKPSVAVLPFVNMSDDPEQEYFSDGITEDLITDLSKLRGLMVIARNSTFAYKGKAVDVRQIGKELGVRHVLEGSVRKVDDQVRINAQLVDATTGDHVWAERFDRPLANIFAIQDEIGQEIIAVLDVKLSEGEQSRRWRGQTNDPVAYDLYLRGRARKLEESREGIRAAVPLLEEAVARDPNFAAPWVWLGWAYWAHVYMGITEDRDAYKQKAIDAANNAIAADPDFGDPHALLSEIAVYDDDLERGILEAEKAVELDPGSSDNWGFLAVQRISQLQPEAGYEAIQRALRLNPTPPAWYHNVHGQTLLALKRYGEAEEAFSHCIAMAPEFVTCHRYLTATHLEARNLEAARRSAKEVVRLIPNYSIAKHEFWHKQAKDPAEQKRRVELLKSAGLPE